MHARATILGSGTSTGVPTLGCGCVVCTSPDPRDQRLRPSLWLHFGGRNVVIDTTPDFRTQALRARIPSLDAVLYTHSHADHIMGMDDIRPFNFGRDAPMPVYGNAGTLVDLQRVFRYVFERTYTASAIPRIAMHEATAPWEMFGARFEPLTVIHGELPILGYRFGSAAYITDCSEIPAAAWARLQGLDVLFLDALRVTPHATHFHLARALEVAAALAPQRTYFTHIAHEIAAAATEATLPPGVHLAYDGLTLEFAI